MAEAPPRRALLVVVGAIALAAVAAALIAVFGTGGDDDAADVPAGPSDDDVEGDDAFEAWLGPAARPDDREAAESSAPGRPARGEEWRSGERRQGGRDRRRGGWGPPDASPEELARRRERFRERFRERVEILPLGPSAPATTADDLFDALGASRQVTRECVRALPNGRDLFRSMRGTEREMSFDLGADGRVLAGTFSIDPPAPPEIATCFEQGLQTLETTPPGPDGARVSFRMPMRRRGPRDGGAR